MKKNEKSVYNIIFGILSQAITLSMGILIPRLYLVTYGSDVNGFLTTINQLYVYVGLLEAGVGMASLSALYKPVADCDRNAVSAIMAATHRYYKRTSLYYFLVVMGLSLVYPLVIKVQEGSISRLTMCLVIFLHGLSGVLIYCFHGKYKVLLEAEGKNYIVINLNSITTILSNLCKIVLVYLGYNIIAIQAAYLLVQTLQVIYLSIYIKKKYAWLDLKVTPNEAAISQKKSVLVHQISSLIFNNTDVIILSTVCGAAVASVYAIYAMIYGVISSLLATLNTGVLYKLADSYHRDRKVFKSQYAIYEEIIFCLIIGMFGVLFIITPNFIRAYTKGVQDAIYEDNIIAIFFVLIYILNNLRTPAVNMVTVSGNFKNTQWRSIIETVINVVVSFSLVFKIGIYGVLMGTAVALLYRTNDLIIFNYRRIIEDKLMKPYGCIMKYGSILACIYFVGKNLFEESSGYVMLAVEAAILGLLYLLLSAVVFRVQYARNSVWKTKIRDLISIFRKEEM